MSGRFVLLAACGLLAGCSSLGKTGDRESNPAGVRTVLVPGQLRTLDLASTIDSFTGSPLAGEVPTEANAEARLNAAIATFYSKGTAAEQAQRRNEIQARVIAAANQRCGLWKNKFAHGAALSGFWFGSVASATTAAATAFSPESTKDALTAIASTASGAGAQYEKSYLFNQTLSVIFQGIDTRRQDILERISAKNLTVASASKPQEPTGIGAYSLSQAVADAIEYHSACTAASGLQKASEALADNRPAPQAPGATPSAATKPTSAGILP